MNTSELTYFEVLLLLVPVAAGILLTRGVGNAMRRRGSSPRAVRSVRVLVTVIWVAVVVAGVELAFGPFPILSTLTVSAVAGIAATLALQTTLQNVIAGFTLLRYRFLRLGDIIQMGGVKGSVVSVGLLAVVIKLESGALATISNANLLSGPMINYTAAERLAGEY